ncbi:TcaA second domain-containing protein, partial [Staphylococcus intermedius]
DKKVQLFSDAIDHKNTDQLIELVISNNQQLTNEEAKAYVSLINSFGGNKKFLHQLTSAAYHLKQNKGKTQDVELEGVTILTIHQQIH